MTTSVEESEPRGSSANSRALLLRTMGRFARSAALTGLMAGALLLLPVAALAAGQEAKKPARAATAQTNPKGDGSRHKVSPYVKARRERAALEEKQQHRPKLWLSPRGAQKARH